MENNKQSSVDWLVSSLLQYIHEAHHPEIVELYEQAKAMHKKEHDKTSEVWFNEGTNVHNGRKYQNFEQYYNETYGGNNE